MPENQNENLQLGILYHFSKKILFLSLLFLLINAAWFGMIVSSQQKAEFQEVSPELVFAGNQIVRLKTPFDDTFFAAEPKQVLFTGTQIHTGEQSFAEIQIDNNVIRLDENTNISLLENNFQNPEKPRFVFLLESGSVWVNAFDSIVIQTPQGEAIFEHTVGVYTYSRPLNRIMSIIGNVDLSLSDEDGNTHFSYTKEEHDQKKIKYLY